METLGLRKFKAATRSASFAKSLPGFPFSNSECMIPMTFMTAKREPCPVWTWVSVTQLTSLDCDMKFYLLILLNLVVVSGTFCLYPLCDSFHCTSLEVLEVLWSSWVEIPSTKGPAVLICPITQDCATSQHGRLSGLKLGCPMEQGFKCFKPGHCQIKQGTLSFKILGKLLQKQGFSPLEATLLLIKVHQQIEQSLNIHRAVLLLKTLRQSLFEALSYFVIDLS